ncbi:MAG: GtrA family protein [Firmicutes bacterium]|nr:GtrA family protein [Bacillota bacterium]
MPMTLFQRIERLPKFFKFSLVGGTNSVVEAVVFEVLILCGTSVILAHVISYTCACINSYTWNRHFTFQSTEKFFGPQLVKFAVVCLITLTLGTGLISILVNVANLQGSLLKDWAAKLLTMALANITDFAGARLWVFRQPPARQIGGSPAGCDACWEDCFDCWMER